MLNYQHLYYFMVIAEEGAIAKASERLRLGQSTLSAQLKLFENHLGLKLFERRHKRLLLTEHGRLALDYAKRLFHLGEEMVEALNDRLVPNRVHVQLGVLDSVPKQIALRLAQAAYTMQSCTVSILEGKGDELMRELLHHRLDLLVTNYAPLSRGDTKMMVKSIGRRPVHVFGVEKHKNLRRGFPQSLQNQAFVMPTHDSRLRADLEHHFRLSGLIVDQVAETQDTSLQRSMAEEGVGLIATSEAAVEDLLKQKRLISLGVLSGVEEEFHLITSSRHFENPVATRLLRDFRI
ncbi:MAG: LysR family transcriptional regulator [Bdellovibrionales bacterium]